MTVDRTTTLIVEPEPGGHHFQAVSTVARTAARTGPVVLLTSSGVIDGPAFAEHLGAQVAAGDVTAHETFATRAPSAVEMADAVARWCRLETQAPVGTVMLMDGDQALKTWWLVAPRRLRGLRHRPRIVMMLTRYPARLALTDLTSWRLRGPKAVLVAVARLTGALHRAVGFSGREDTARGWLVKRVRDPHYSSAHAADRATWRSLLDLPADDVLVGIFGALDARKNPALVLDAITAVGLDARLVLAGRFDEGVRAWVDGLDAAARDRVIARDAFLSNADLDRYVAAVDVVPLALTNNGPSGIMGKAQAAGVPVVTAGSLVRAREVVATGTGLAADLTPASLGQAMRTIVDGGFSMPVVAPESQVTPEEFAAVLLGTGPAAAVGGRR